MKAIVIDYLRRWKWVFILTTALQIILHIVTPPEHSTLGLLAVIYCGAMLLSFDLARGTPRVCLALPVTRKDLSSSWRTVAITAPLLLFAANLLAGNLLRIVIGIGQIISISQGTFWIFFAFVWLSVSFHLLVHFPNTAGAQDPTRKVKNGIIGGLWGLTLGGGFLVIMKMPKDWSELQGWHWVLLGAGLVSSALGWMSAEQMVINRAGPGRASEDLARLSSRKEEKEFAGMKETGLTLLFRSVTMASLRSICIFLVIAIGFQIFLQKSSFEGWLDWLRRVIQDPMIMFMLAPLVLITGLQWLPGIRHFRTLPMRGSRLALLVCALFVVPTLLLCGTMGVLQFSLGVHGMTLDWLSRILFMTAPMLLAPGLLLHFGLSWRSYFLVIMPVFGGAPLASVLLPYVTVPVRALICAGLWAVGGYFIHRSITRRSETYRHSLRWPMTQQAS